MGSLSLRRQDLVPRMVPALHAILHYGSRYILAPLLSGSLFQHLTGAFYDGAFHSPPIAACAMDCIWYRLCLGDFGLYLLCTCRIRYEGSHIKLQRTTMAQELESCGFVKNINLCMCAIILFCSSHFTHTRTHTHSLTHSHPYPIKSFCIHKH